MQFQTIIVIVIVAIAAFFMIRRFYNGIQKSSSSTCGCGCEGCAPSQKQNCTELEDKST
ncbi:MAG: FeoB-associated Cys-rich membrane protein [Desulfobacteraceae bacterium]|jgi:purine-cytosine permease-like protein